MQYLDRSTLSNWVKFMAHNPHYFAYVFRVPLTEANLEAAAVQIFGREHVQWKPTVKVWLQPKIEGSMQFIGDYLGIGRSQIWFHYKHNSLPVKKVGNHYAAYIGVLRYWAKKRKVGMFNGR